MTGIVEAALVYVFDAFAGSTFLSYVIVIAASTYIASESARKQQNQAKDAYNASLRDRYVMGRGATEPRQLVLGRQRVSGPLFYVGSYGTSRSKLVFTVAIAGHEVDAIEGIYFDDELVTLDGSGNVLGVNRRDLFSISTAGAAFTLTSAPKAGSVTAVAKYGTTSVTLGTSVAGSVVTVSGATAGQTGTVTISYLPDPSPYVPNPVVNAIDTVVLNGSGNGTRTLAQTPIAGSLQITDGVSGVDVNILTAYGSLAGAVLTVTGSPVVSITAPVSYQYIDTSSRARVRTYTGAPGQVADAGMIAALPGIWTSAHKATGVAYLVVELDYDPNAFPSGLPNVSALVRGAKVYDPRTGTTAWSENPALLIRAAATHALCGRLATSAVNDTAIIAAANVCDAAANYVVNGRTYARAFYTAGLVHRSGTRPADTINDLAQAMAGKWTFIDGLLRVKAGSFVTPLQTLDESWLHDGQPVHIQPRSNRSDVYNTVTGKFVDEQSDWQVLDYPQVQAAAYVSEDGIALPLDVQLNAVTFVGQAQQVVAAMMRDARQGLRVTLVCNMRAYPVEVFDVIYVSLARFGWVLKPFEVYGVSFTLDGGIQLSLKESDATAWALGTTFPDTDPAPNTLLPSPFQVQALAGLSCASGSAQQADGTFQTRIVASWTALTDPGVISNGGVDVRYGAPSIDPSQWTTITVFGTQAQALLPGVKVGQVYMVQARAFNTLCKGAWCLPVIHTVNTSGRIDTAQLALNAATEIQTTTVSGVSVTGLTGVPTGSFTTIATISFTASAAGELLIIADGGASLTTPASGTAGIDDRIALTTRITVNGTRLGPQRTYAIDAKVGFSATASTTIARSQRTTVTAGTAYTIVLQGQQGSGTATVDVDNLQMRTELVKR